MRGLCFNPLRGYPAGVLMPATEDLGAEANDTNYGLAAGIQTKDLCDRTQGRPADRSG